MTMFNPPHPGEFIRDTYIVPLNISLRSCAKKLNISPSTFTRLINGDSDISPIMALKLSKAFGRTPQSWMMMQAEHALWKTQESINLDDVSVIYQSQAT